MVLSSILRILSRFVLRAGYIILSRLIAYSLVWFYPVGLALVNYIATT
jgi:hypothetical protein